MDRRTTSAPRAVAAQWATPIAASFGLPLLFLVGLIIVSVALTPVAAPLWGVAGALLAALLLQRMVPGMRWPSVTLVTFWFLVATMLGGWVMMLLSNADIVPRTLIGIGAMFAVQAARVFVQFVRARRG